VIAVIGVQVHQMQVLDVKDVNSFLLLVRNTIT